MHCLQLFKNIQCVVLQDKAGAQPGGNNVGARHCCRRSSSGDSDQTFSLRKRAPPLPAALEPEPGFSDAGDCRQPRAQSPAQLLAQQPPVTRRQERLRQRNAVPLPLRSIPRIGPSTPSAAASSGLHW